MGDYTASLPFVNEMSGKGATNTIFSKNATVTGKYNEIFGGGRGVSADSNTVTGNSNVLIQGVNTNVTNYGSVK